MCKYNVPSNAPNISATNLRHDLFKGTHHLSKHRKEEIHMNVRVSEKNGNSVYRDLRMTSDRHMRTEDCVALHRAMGEAGSGLLFHTHLALGHNEQLTPSRYSYIHRQPYGTIIRPHPFTHKYTRTNPHSHTATCTSSQSHSFTYTNTPTHGHIHTHTHIQSDPHSVTLIDTHKYTHNHMQSPSHTATCTQFQSH